MKRIYELFPALQNKNYRLYFAGQLVSLIGTWLQIVAESWLVLTLTNSAFLIGMVAACATLPMLIFSLFGGVIVDRFSKKKIIMICQIAAMILAAIYGVLIITNVITIWQIMVLAFLLGVINAIDWPARQAYTIEIVGKKGLTSAVALNAGVFNGARVIGPSIAGLLIIFIGTGGAFLVNSVSYLGAIAALYLMHVSESKHGVDTHPLRAIKQGIIYSYTHPQIKYLLTFTAAASIFGWSYTTVMPYIAKNTLLVGAAGLGYLYAAVGLGAVLSTFLVSGYGKRISQNTFIIGGIIMFGISIIGFSYANSVLIALPFLFISGVGLLACFSTINAGLQHAVDDKFRGRVMSIYILVFVGLFPVGNFEVGLVSEHWGAANAVRVGAVICILAGIIYFFARNSIKRKQKAYEVSISEKQATPDAVLSQSEW